MTISWKQRSLKTAPDPFSIAADILDPPSDTWKPLPHQIPPPGNWFVWLLLGGRGSGKTATTARFVHDHVHGPPCLPGVPGGHWISIVAPTLGDAVTSCVNGPSGLRVHDPGIKVRQTAGGSMVRWSNGAEAKLFGAHTPEDVERFRSGGNRCLLWAEEMAAWRYLDEAWAHLRFGLRVGPHPQAVISTTPKNRKLLKEILKKSVEEPDKYKVTKATTHDNPHLHEDRRHEIIEDFGGSRLGRQEIYAEILEDAEGALWNEDMINRNRIRPIDAPREMDLMVVGVDPQAKDGGAETGIIVGGLLRQFNNDKRTHGFVFGDYTISGKPEEWARASVRAYKDWLCNRVVAEINNGGDMVTSTLRQIDPTLPIVVVHASRGKAVRAEPVSTLYEQNRIHHVGYFPELEAQMTEFDAMDPDGSWSPDRMDALVWAFTYLMVKQSVMRASQTRDRRHRGRR